MIFEKIFEREQQQKPTHKQAKFSQKELEEIYKKLCLYEFCIDKDKSYKVIEECDGNDSLILETLDNMSN